MPVSLQPLSRRRFLQSSLAFGVTAALPRLAHAAGAAPRALGPTGATTGTAPSRDFDHLALFSDVHASGKGKGNMAAYFEHASKQLLALRRRPAAVLVAGDCAHLKGKAADYEAFVRLTRPIADAGLPMHITLGNHDQRDNFWQAVGTEQADADLGRQAGVVEGRHANWLLLDSLDKTNQGAGELGADQLDWLAAALDARTDRPAILMLHHNPDHPRRGGSLRDSDALLEIARPRRHVKAICFGHTHVWETARDRSGIHMVNLPATGYTLWLRSFVGWTDWRVDGRGADLTVHAIKHADRDNNQTLRLDWRD